MKLGEPIRKIEWIFYNLILVFALLTFSLYFIYLIPESIFKDLLVIILIPLYIILEVLVWTYPREYGFKEDNIISEKQQ